MTFGVLATCLSLLLCIYRAESTSFNGAPSIFEHGPDHGFEHSHGHAVDSGDNAGDSSDYGSKLIITKSSCAAPPKPKAAFPHSLMQNHRARMFIHAYQLRPDTFRQQPQAHAGHQPSTAPHYEEPIQRMLQVLQVYLRMLEMSAMSQQQQQQQLPQQQQPPQQQQQDPQQLYLSEPMSMSRSEQDYQYVAAFANTPTRRSPQLMTRVIPGDWIPKGF